MSRIHHFGFGILLNVPFSSNLLSSFGGRFKCGWNHNREFNFWKKLTLTHFNLLFILCIICLSYYYISKKSKYHKNLHLPLDLRFIFISPQEYLSPILNKKDFIVMRKLTAVFVMELKIANLRGKSGKCQYFTSSNTSETLTILSISIWWSPLHYWSLFPENVFLFDGPKFGKKCSCT